MKKRILFSLLFCAATSLTAQEKIEDQLTYSQSVKSVKLPTEEIAYTDAGSGEKTLLFIHGLSSNLEAWNKNIEGLKSQYRCIAIDLPGYGKSSKNKEHYSLAGYAEMIQDFSEELGLKNVILVGHSMGGQVAIHTVLKAPDAFEKLILIAPAGIETFTEKEATVMKVSYTPNMVTNTTDDQILANYKMNFYEFPEDAQAMVDERIKMKSAEDFPRYAKVVVNNIHAMLDEPVIDKLHEIKIPVFVIFGKNDMLIPNKYFHPSQSLAHLLAMAEDKVPDLKTKVIDEAGHFVNFEKPEEVNLAIKNFLSQ